VELRPKEDNPEEQRQNADEVSLGLHVLTRRSLGKNGCGVKKSIYGLGVLLATNLFVRASKVLS
jgi:hypothetical protein